MIRQLWCHRAEISSLLGDVVSKRYESQRVVRNVQQLYRRCAKFAMRDKRLRGMCLARIGYARSSLTQAACCRKIPNPTSWIFRSNQNCDRDKQFCSVPLQLIKNTRCPCAAHASSTGATVTRHLSCYGHALAQGEEDAEGPHASSTNVCTIEGEQRLVFSG